MNISDEEVNEFLAAWSKTYLDRNMQLRASLEAALKARKRLKRERKATKAPPKDWTVRT